MDDTFTQIEINIQKIANGFIVSRYVSRGYDGIRSDATHFSTLEGVTQHATDLIRSADEAVTSIMGDGADF